jgi:hypothetical protein
MVVIKDKILMLTILEMKWKVFLPEAGRLSVGLC